MSNVSPSILLLNEAPDDDEWKTYFQIAGIVVCLYFVLCAEMHFRADDRIDAIIGPQAVVERVEGRIEKVQQKSYPRRITYTYTIDGVEKSDRVSCRHVSICNFLKPGTTAILVNRAVGVSWPEPMLKVAPLIQKRALWRGRMAAVLSVAVLLIMGIFKVVSVMRRKGIW